MPVLHSRGNQMNLGLAAWGFRETPLERQLAITGELGLCLLELSIAGHRNDVLQLDSSSSVIASVGKLFKDYGVSLNCACAGNDFTLPEKKDNLRQLENLKGVIDIASELGVRNLRIFAGFSPRDEVADKRWAIMIECLWQTAEYAAQKRIVPAIETHGGVTVTASGVKHFHSTSSHPGTLKRILEVMPDNVKINFDPANLYAVGVEHPEEVYLQFKDRISYAHLKDFAPVPGSDSLRPAACGESGMDWKALLKTMQDFSGPALIEYENVEDVENGCRRSLSFLKSLEP